VGETVEGAATRRASSLKTPVQSANSRFEVTARAPRRGAVGEQDEQQLGYLPLPAEGTASLFQVIS
jgi:hypothetical protein